MVLCFTAIAATVVAGAYFYSRDKGGTLFSLVSTLAFGTALAAMVSVFCLYIYELPTHHCPFCILQKEYGYIGYVLYAALLGGAVAGLSVGILMPFRARGSMAAVIPPLQRKLAVTAVFLYWVFAALISPSDLLVPVSSRTVTDSARQSPSFRFHDPDSFFALRHPGGFRRNDPGPCKSPAIPIQSG